MVPFIQFHRLFGLDANAVIDPPERHLHVELAVPESQIVALPLRLILRFAHYHAVRGLWINPRAQRNFGVIVEPADISGLDEIGSVECACLPQRTWRVLLRAFPYRLWRGP